MRKAVLLFMMLLPLTVLQNIWGQQYTGMSGLIHVPSADMDYMGDVRLGLHFMNKEFTPDMMSYNGKYHTISHYLSITPFKWLEIGYTCTLLRAAKQKNGVEDLNDVGLYRKDRYFSVKIRPIVEKDGKWWPSIALGTNDPYTTSDNSESTYDLQEGKQSLGNNVFSNFYIAVSKHFNIRTQCLGVHLAYRDWKRKENDKWNGLVGGITFQPSFQKNLRVIAEYTGDDMNVGLDCLLWKHLLLQASLQDGKYFSGGVCFQMNLF